MKPVVRIKDIADRANVSTGTVDRVIHNRGRVDPNVQKRVMRILSEMNYRPNMIARALGSNKLYRIAVVMPDPYFDSYWRTPQEGIEKAEAGLRQYGVTIQQYAYNPYIPGSFYHRAKLACDAGADGILIAPLFHQEALSFFKEWQENNIPFVLFNTQIAESGALSYVGQDAYQSGMLAGKMIHYGQPNPCSILIAHIDEEISIAAQLANKEQGFRDYFKQAAGGNRYNIIRSEMNMSNLSGFTRDLGGVIDSTPNLQSIYVTTSKAYEIAAYLEQRNITHIKVVGYDLLPKNMDYLDRGNISFLINQNPKGQGYWGIHQLANHLVFKKEVLPLKHLPLDVVTKENAAYYVKDEMIFDDYNPTV